MLGTYLGRGVAAGLLAGLAAGLFAYFFGEPQVDRALALEQGGAFNQVVDRPTQRLGLIVAVALYGAAVGAVFGLAFASLRNRMAAGDDWTRSLRLSAALFAGLFFLPFLKYPADPPGTGDPSNIGVRTVVYLVTVAVCVAAIFTAWSVANTLREQGTGKTARQAVVGAGLVIVLAAFFSAMPPATSPKDFPGDVLWDFRVSAVGTQLVLWAGLGALFGALCERANRKKAAL
jgi:predicted cobalt transporter CbtA